MSKSIIINKTGGPEVLKLEEVDVGSPKPNEIKIKNTAIGLNFIDTYHRSGLYPVKLPSGIGMEASAIIEEVGSDVKKFNKGDKIAYASPPLGAYSELRNIPSEIAVKLPNDINEKIAASIMTKGLTTYYLLNQTYKPGASETILFHAAAGGVGQIFCQWAKSLGCKLIGTVGSEEKINIAKEYGCDFVINYKKDNFAKKINEITNGMGVDVVYDGVGKDTFLGSVECLKERGMMISFGNSSGPLEPINVPKSIQPKALFFTRPSLRNYLKGEELDNAGEQLFKQIKFGKVKVKIFNEYGLSEASKAHKDLEARKIIGPAILIPDR